MAIYTLFRTMNVTFSIPVFPVVLLLRLNIFSQNVTFVADHNKGRNHSCVCYYTINFNQNNTHND